MADYFVNEKSLTNIANAIRNKAGISGELEFPNDFITAINNINGTGSDTPGDVDTSDATATANDILSGKTAYVNGQKITGTIASQAAQTITPGTSNKTIAAGKYLSGVQTIKGDSNLIANNIKNGVSIFGVTGNYEGAAIPTNLDLSSLISTTQSTTTIPITYQSKTLIYATVPTFNLNLYRSADSTYIGQYSTDSEGTISSKTYTGTTSIDWVWDPEDIYTASTITCIYATV